ncbi:uncharacterized protein LOC113774206 [Coffea eugenioides]|uniref:uncharacterized protein LOC113774206 n=1 Tax=Coffea eugenioides TaxID=49369 RepID=UPI000F604800|nr:uncharacterized protein LOC113774206 [Coffea eugenioides]
MTVSQGGPVPAPRVSCGYCGKTNHTENTCWRKIKKCLHCGSSEHQIAACPVKPREENEGSQLEKSNPEQPTASGSRPRVSARVYVLDHQRVLESFEVVEGERKLVIDLISLDLKRYDVTLGMDWLARYNAKLNCKTQVVQFCIPKETTLRLDVRDRLFSSALISEIRVKKILNKGVQGYLAFLINIPGDKVKLEDVLVMNEFFDIFPDELKLMPLEREIEFKIDLVRGTTPIAKTPYRMAPTELKELKLQLQNLLECKFIRESESP